MLVSCALLRSLKLHSAPLLFKVALYAISFLSQALGEALFRLIPSQLLLLLEPVLLRPEPRLEVLLLSLLSRDAFVFLASLHLFKFHLQVFLFLHHLLVVTVISDPLTVAELAFHLVTHLLELLIVSKTQLLLHQVFLVIELSSDSVFLVLEHLSEALLYEVAIVRELFFTLCSHPFVLPAGAQNDILLLFLAARRGSGSLMRRSGLLIVSVATGTSYMSVAVDFLRLALMQSACRPVSSG